MDQERALDIERVTHAMDATRQSIRDTVDELKERVHESADWRHYVAARPITSLVVAAACGVALARILMPAARLVRIPLLVAPRIVRRAPPSRSSATWSRLFGAAGLLTELAALPSLISQIRQVVRRPGGRTRR
jgi:hypothetical protein